MIKNLEIYEKDPLTHTLLNQGVAKLSTEPSTEQLETLRYELANFVCDGQYEEGLRRILSSYLGDLDKSEQRGVWVSGFFGSGKSHLVKMLQYLWTDFTFPDGTKARGLAKLPDSVTELLRELSNAAKRHGGLHAAAGDLQLEGKESIRLSLLGVIFKSVGLPGDYTRACFQMWLREEGLESGIRQFIVDNGGTFEDELRNLYISKLMAQAILAHRPEFASKPSEVASVLENQFPKQAKDVSTDDMIDAIKRAVGRKGKLPCMVVILDEVQQYIGDAANRSKAVQDLQEQCGARLGARFLLVATGQTALSGTPLLQKLTGRFPLRVELQDTDVEQVTREVVLKKKPTAEAGLKKFLEDHSGEIERQLAQSKIAFSSSDRDLLVQDYPILPVRRRFWERVLRAVDKAGTGAQLRNQLGIVHEAVKQTAQWPLGNVVSGAFIYDASIKSSALNSGTLLQEVSETIAKQGKGADGELRYQICALIFLIGQLPRENAPLDAGIRADAETIADLLVTDLGTSSAPLRKQVSILLETLVADGAIMRIENEYRMQTREGAEWNRTFVEARNQLLGDSGGLAGATSQLLRTQCGEIVKKIPLRHGESKVPRRIELCFGDSPPSLDGPAIQAWIRDGWEFEEKAVLDDARAASESTAVVYAFIPKRSAEELRQAIAGHNAAKATLESRGHPSSEEGIHARKAMETLQEQSRRKRDDLIAEILNETQVYLAGGEGLGGAMFSQKLHEGATRCLDRLYPRFHEVDSPHWPKVAERVKKGDGDPLAAVGHKGDHDKHPVCKAILDFVGSSKKGTEIRKHHGAPPYGWPQDAVDAALVVLVNAGLLQARAGAEPVAKGKLDQKNIAIVEFRRETTTITKPQLIELRGLFKKIGLNTRNDEESAHAVQFLSNLTALAESAGGEPPLPKRPDTNPITDMANLVGNDQLRAIHENRETLAKQIAAWTRDRDLIGQRFPRWSQAVELLGFAADLPAAAEVEPELAAIKKDRALLANPDPVPVMVEKLTSALRTALNEAHGGLSTEHENRMTALETDPNWTRIKPAERKDILSASGIRSLPAIAVGTTQEVLETLRRTKLGELRAIRDALPTRFQNAAAAAARLIEPEVQRVQLPGGTIRNEDELKAWLDEAGNRIREKMKDGPVIV